MHFGLLSMAKALDLMTTLTNVLDNDGFRLDPDAARFAHVSHADRESVFSEHPVVFAACHRRPTIALPTPHLDKIVLMQRRRAAHERGRFWRVSHQRSAISSTKFLSSS